MKKTLLALLLLALATVTSAFGQIATLSQASQVFGGTVVGVSGAAQNITLTNTGSAILSSISISITGANSADFATTTTPATNCGGSLTTGSPCTLSTVFTPGGVGSRTATINITSNAATVTVSLTGFGVGFLQPGGIGPIEVYSAASAAGSVSIAATNMLTATQVTAAQTFEFSFYLDQVAAGVGCAGNSTITVSVIFTDPNAASSTTISVATAQITANGAAGTVLTPSPNLYPLRSKAASAVQFSTTYTAGASCTTNPTYQIFPILKAL